MKLESMELKGFLVMILWRYTVNNHGCGHKNDNGLDSEMRASLKTCA